MSIPRDASSRFRICAFAVGLALLASPASAVSTNSFSIPPEAVTVSGFATQSGAIALGLPASFFITFVLPRNYLNGGAVKIVLYLSTAVGPCTAHIVPVQLVRKRIGVPIVNDLSGLTGGPTVDLAGGVLKGKTFTLQPGDLMPGQRRGDAITVQISREADDGTDTCGGHVHVQAIDIRYPSP